MSTMDTLVKKGTLVDNKCVLCCKQGESASHLLFHCPTVAEIWNYFRSYVHMDWVMPNCIDLIIKGWRVKNLSTTGQALWKVLPTVITWTIWRSRNDLIFNGKLFEVQQVITKVKAQFYYWCKNLEALEGISLENVKSRWGQFFVI
ncbi:uncharacterized protein LOC113340963 [Papaver somniferum]|uniref:uncharacterized protein LOC113340963 n=1 Tax=Papaver somniferum TaxID=3469 RepID=UPI000E70358F|nr:uncharacterized protein LOC113340963 [Papaver somniferum]